MRNGYLHFGGKIKRKSRWTLLSKKRSRRRRQRGRGINFGKFIGGVGGVAGQMALMPLRLVSGLIGGI